MTAAEYKSLPKRKTRNDDPEHRLQVACVKWFEMQYPDVAHLLIASANKGKRNLFTAIRLKAEGVKPGVPDLFLAITTPEYPGLWIEMKSPKGKETPEQLFMIDELDRQRYAVAVCRSVEQFIEVVQNYLGE